MAYYLDVEEITAKSGLADGDHETHLVAELARLKRRVVYPPALLESKNARRATGAACDNQAGAAADSGV